MIPPPNTPDMGVNLADEYEWVSRLKQHPYLLYVIAVTGSARGIVRPAPAPGR
jgi:hypothetical protein